MSSWPQPSLGTPVATPSLLTRSSAFFENVSGPSLSTTAWAASASKISSWAYCWDWSSGVASTTSGSLPAAAALVMSVASWSSGTPTSLVLMPVFLVKPARISSVIAMRSGCDSLFQTVSVSPPPESEPPLSSSPPQPTATAARTATHVSTARRVFIALLLLLLGSSRRR